MPALQVTEDWANAGAALTAANAARPSATGKYLLMLKSFFMSHLSF
jgi:hypothetical protein